MTIKIVYDFSRPRWNAYGRVLFLPINDASAASPSMHAEADVRAAAQRAILEVEGDDITIDRLEIRPASAEEFARWLEHTRRVVHWMRNTADGIPNRREDL